MSTDIHALSGAYAIDALDPAERAAFEQHLAGCATCRAEVDGLREAAASMSALGPVAPPAELRERVLGSVSAVRPLPPASPIPLRGSRRRWWTGAALVAAAVVVVAFAWHPWTSSSRSAVAADQVISAPDAQQVGRRLPDGATVTVYRSARLGKAAIVAQDLPSLAGGHVYELWLEDRAGTMRPAGFLPAGGHAETVLDGSARTAKAAGITVEPDGGSRTPTTTPIAVLRFTRG